MSTWLEDWNAYEKACKKSESARVEAEIAICLAETECKASIDDSDYLVWKIPGNKKRTSKRRRNGRVKSRKVGSAARTSKKDDAIYITTSNVRLEQVESEEGTEFVEIPTSSTEEKHQKAGKKVRRLSKEEKKNRVAENAKIQCAAIVKALMGLVEGIEVHPVFKKETVVFDTSLYELKEKLYKSSSDDELFAVYESVFKYTDALICWLNNHGVENDYDTPVAKLSKQFNIATKCLTR